MKRRVAKIAARRPAARPATSRFDRANTNGQRAITLAITIAITGFASRYFVFLWRYYACYYGFTLAITRANTDSCLLLHVLIHLKMSITISALIQSCECYYS